MPRAGFWSGLRRQELTRLREAVRLAKADAIAISLLFSFGHPRERISHSCGRGDLGKPLSVSHRILPEFREYERTSNGRGERLSAATYAELHGKAGGARDERGGCAKSLSLESLSRGSFVMQSSGGITALESAAREPVRTVLSGPAGGLVGAAAMARAQRARKILSFDMGGTSTECGGRAGRGSSWRPVRSGGASRWEFRCSKIQHRGRGGRIASPLRCGWAMRVGPESAGADPGPICYGQRRRNLQ